jgi:hypothetical protein
LGFLLTSFAVSLPPDAKAQDPPAVNGQLGIYNVIERVEIIDGQLFAIPVDGQAIPLDLSSLGRRPRGGPAAPCPILNLELGPIDLNLLGLLVRTSPICLEITADPTGGLLGNLLCSVARLLDQGIPLQTILGNLTPAEQTLLTDALRDIVNGALNQFNEAQITDLQTPNGENSEFDCPTGTCTILALTLGPLDLNILGLRVYLHDCEDGAVELYICADPLGGLLGQLLCGLLGPNPTLQDLLALLGVSEATLQDLINYLLGLAGTTNLSCDAVGRA